MSKKYNEKREKAALNAIDRELDSGYGKVDADAIAALDSRDAAMGKGELELFEKKQSKEEKKAAAKAAREAKKKAKESNGKGKSASNSDNDDMLDDEGEEKKTEPTMGEPHKSSVDMAALEQALSSNDLSAEERQDAASEWLSAQQISVTYTAKKGRLHANTRDINVSGVTVNFHGKPLVEDTDLVINYGNRYGFIGPNGSGKVRWADFVVIAARDLVIGMDHIFTTR
jgi:ATP-binding cassette, subfamily F, member 2